MTDGRVGYLRCPKCAENVTVSGDGKSLFCVGTKRHCYDFSASGYINLAPEHSGGGDSKSAVRSRADFLSSGAYDPVLKAILGALEKYLPQGGCVIDAGCGEGYYSCGISERGYSVLGFDLSKDAVLSASKRAKRRGIPNAFFAVSSVYSLPVRDGAADAVVNIFAPCVEEEYRRVLVKNGILLVVYAGADHLLGMKRAIYDKVYENEERADMPRGMKLLEEISVNYLLTLDDKKNISDLFSMTPYYWRTSQGDREKLDVLEALETEIDIKIAVYGNEDIS